MARNKLLDQLMAVSESGELNAMASGSELLVLPLDRLDGHPNNRDINWDKVEELAQSILKDGLGQAILVRPMINGRYQIVAGHHRWEAVKLLHERFPEDPRFFSIEAISRSLSDAEAMALLKATALFAPDTTVEERGRMFEEFKREEIPRLRKENPERYRGVSAGEIIADMAKMGGSKVNRSTVYRNMAAARAAAPEFEGMTKSQAIAVSRMTASRRKEARRVFDEQGKAALDRWIVYQDAGKAEALMSKNLETIRVLAADVKDAVDHGFTVDGEALCRAVEALEGIGAGK